MVKGLVSIIMPTYNSAFFIEEAIQSVMNQTYANWELIIIDDGSTDNTQQIVQSLIYDWPNITYNYSEHNKGTAHARNRGMSLAKGQFLAFLDSDDVWLNKKLELQVSFIQSNKEAVFTFSSYRRMSYNGEKISQIIPAAEKISRNDLFNGNNIPLLTVVINREALGDFKFNEHMMSCEDYCLWLEILNEVPVAHGLDSDLARYRNTKRISPTRRLKSILGVVYIYFILEYENLFLSVSRFMKYARNGIKKRTKFPINIENRMVAKASSIHE
jgi:teichuronic acid biosynthesis glycosyltransferase TuaG